MQYGGEGGIRTHDTVSRIHAFQACALSHSATSPQWKIGRQYSGGVPRYNPRPGPSLLTAVTGVAGQRRHQRSDRVRKHCPQALVAFLRDRCRRPGGTIPRRFRYSARLRRGEAGGRHGSWAIVMAPRHSAPDRYFDVGAWRPSRLILPSGSGVVSAYEGPTPSRAFSLRASAAMRVILH
jgi:hypothetical protein